MTVITTTLGPADVYDAIMAMFPTAEGIACVQGEGVITVTVDSGLTEQNVQAAVNAYVALSFSRLQDAALANVEANRTASLLAFTFQGNAIPLTDATQGAINAAYVWLSNPDNAGQTISWQVTPRLYLPVNLEAITALGLAAGTFVQAGFSNSEALAAQIVAATTADQINAVPNTGWPVGT